MADSADSSLHILPGNDGWCFVCGAENPIGLRTTWSLDEDGVVRTRFEPSREHQGWIGVVHGGILSALLDEAMAQRMGLEGRPVATASLTVRFRRPAPTTATLIVEARIKSERARVLQLKALVRSEAGECYAEADGTCVRIRGEAHSEGEDT